MIELERFSEAARRALTLAHHEARYVARGAIEPGHLLFGVVQEAPEWAATLSGGRLTPDGGRRCEEECPPSGELRGRRAP